MTNPKIIALIKEEIAKCLEKGEDGFAKRNGFGGGFDKNTPDPTVFVFTGGINKLGEAYGSIMQQNLTMANLVYGQYGFMNSLQRRFRDGDVYMVINCQDGHIKPMLVKRW